MFGLSISPAIGLAAFLAFAAAGYWIVDTIGDIREANVRAEWAEVDRQKAEAIEKAAAEAVAARTAAQLPGALKRLQTNWCRDCKP